MILITGAEGFLGSYLVPRLKQAGYDVCILRYGENAQIGNNTWVGDITRPEHIDYFKKTTQEVNTVIHLAGKVDIDLINSPISSCDYPVPGKEDIYSLYLHNVIGTVNVLNLCLDKKVSHLLFASSQTVYGFPPNSNFTEEMICNPLEYYAASKISAEQLLKVGTRQGLNVTVLRFPGLYGENRTDGIVYNFCKSALSSGKITVTTEIPLPLDIIHVDDVVDAFEKALLYQAKAWNCLNIATGESCSINLLAEAIASLVPECQVKYGSVPQPETSMNSRRAFDLLGWKALPRQERLLQMLDKVSKDISKT